MKVGEDQIHRKAEKRYRLAAWVLKQVHDAT
jgi:hypothetical protein